MSDIRAKLRNKTIGGKKSFKRETVEFDGETYEFVQPSLRLRQEITSKARKGDDIDQMQLMVEAIIGLTVIPGTDERIFEEGDKESMLEFPSGSFVEKFAEKSVQVLVGNLDLGKDATES